ncbi:probable E3 ubiquitin-protein ligase ARI7 [Setaria italica]|nr:probable E3 ubiquitin-protein ligase ARI7 [Setaria italica]XP_034580984.1 probable E3 ubiquitin-protein ligase ARI7 [Setaria viridis]
MRYCNRYPAGDGESEFAEEETQREQARASLERYLHYYERWTEHGASMRKARQDLDALEGSGLDELADAIGVPPTELGFLLDAHAQIVEARRVLRWTYAYVYYLQPERDRAKRELCEYLQGEAERSLEVLHLCAERNFVSATRHAAVRFAEFRQKLCNLTLVTRSHFSKLVEGFESGMAEVVS